MFTNKAEALFALDALDQVNQLQIAANLTAELKAGGKSGADALKQLTELARRYGRENDGAAGTILMKVQALSNQMGMEFDLADLLATARGEQTT